MPISPRPLAAALALLCLAGADTAARERPRRARSLAALGGPVGGGPSLGFPIAVASDSSGAVYVGNLLARRGSIGNVLSILRIEPDGTRTIVSDVGHGSGPGPFGTVLFFRTDGLLTDGWVTIDPASGVRTALPPLDPPLPPLAGAFARLLEPEGTMILESDDGLIRSEQDTGDWVLVSGCVAAECRGAGPALTRVDEVARAEDGTLFAAQPQALIGVDASTGDRELLSGAALGAGPALGVATGLIPDGPGHVLWARASAVLRIELASGDRTVVTDEVTGSGPVLRTVEGIARESAGTVLLADADLGAVLRLDLATGARSIVSGGPIGTGPRPTCVSGGAREATGAIVIADCDNGLARIDLLSGDRSVVSDAVTGSGPSFMSARDVAVSSTGELLVADVTTLKGVDPVNGDRRVVSDGGRGGFRDLSDVVPESAGSVLVGDRGLHKTIQVAPRIFFETYRHAAVRRVNLATGRARLVSGGGFFSNQRGAGSGFYLLPLRALAAAGTGALAAFRGPELIRVDAASGDRTLVSSENRGSGPGFDHFAPMDVAVDGAGHWLVVDASEAHLVQVDPATGDRTILSGAGRGSGPLFERPRVILVDPSGALTVVSEGEIGVPHPFTSVIRVDPATGDRTVLSRY